MRRSRCATFRSPWSTSTPARCRVTSCRGSPRWRQSAAAAMPSSIGEASGALAAGRIAGIVVVPQNFSRDAMRGTPTAVTVFGTGAYPVQDSAVLGSVGAVVQSVAGEVTGARMAHQGAPAAALLQSARAGPAFVDQPLYNLARGYGSYVVSAVGILIVQQVMLMAIAALVGTWLEATYGHPVRRAGGRAGRVAAAPSRALRCSCSWRCSTSSASSSGSRTTRAAATWPARSHSPCLRRSPSPASASRWAPGSPTASARSRCCWPRRCRSSSCAGSCSRARPSLRRSTRSPC